MRFLLINNHCISDQTAGVVQSLRTMIRWLVEAGHECRVLTTARFEAFVSFTIDEHLDGLGVEIQWTGNAAKQRIRSRQKSQPKAKCDEARFSLDGAGVTLLKTRHNDEKFPNHAETTQYLSLLSQILDEFPPERVIACNAHPMILLGLKEARQRGIPTVYAIRGYGYYDRRYFEHVDHVFTCSQHVSDVHFAKVGLLSTPIEPPIEWSRVVAPAETRAFLTFVNPSPHKGLWLFARLADMLGSRRPDIPIMVVQSGQTAGWLNRIKGVDFTRYPQIMAAPPVPRPADYFALTQVLLVPSVWEEPFGRVAAEAMINGVPPLVSNRGSLPHVVGGDYTHGGGGFVLPLPDWLQPTVHKMPTVDEVAPWYDAVCALWDDPALYAGVAERARCIAAERFDEEASRKRHLEYLTSLTPGQPLFAPTAGDGREHT
jgi:glycosyltransferase involved in cell wall biosynthesis